MRRIGSRAVKWLVVAAVAALLSPVSMSFAAVLNDEVTSIKLKEADGTSGQSTNSGSGVKTGHIQDGAVTDAKITGPISGAKLGAHAHNSSDIVGIISTSNLPVGTTSGTIAAGDHAHNSLYQKKYANTAVVAKGGGDYTDPVDALNNIATWCGTPSATNPCLLKIMPGVYDLGSNVLTAINFVDIDGSGKNNTIISGSISSPTYLANWITNSSLSNITINNYISGTDYFAIRINSSSPEIRNVNVLGRGILAVMVSSGSPNFNDVTIDSPAGTTAIETISGNGTYKNIKILNAMTAIYNYGSDLTITNLESSAGVIDQGKMTIVNSTFGNLRVLPMWQDQPTVANVVNSQILGDITRDLVPDYLYSIRCINSYDVNYGAVTCPSW